MARIDPHLVNGCEVINIIDGGNVVKSCKRYPPALPPAQAEPKWSIVVPLFTELAIMPI
jgi:hypothetical protein